MRQFFNIFNKNHSSIANTFSYANRQSIVDRRVDQRTLDRQMLQLINVTSFISLFTVGSLRLITVCMKQIKT
jgi:hypothetical protein